MTREINEELRRRMLADEGVQQMIQRRAYEIYQQRGGAQGREAEDWLQAESEVLLYLISQSPSTGEAVTAKKTSSRKSPATRKKKTETAATEKKPVRRAAKKTGESEAKPKKTQRTRKKKEQ